MYPTVTDAHLSESAARLQGADVSDAMAQRETLGDLLGYAAWLVAIFGVAAAVVASGFPVVTGPVTGLLVAVASATSVLGAGRAAGRARSWASEA